MIPRKVFPALFGSLFIISAVNYRTNQSLQEMALNDDDQKQVKTIIVQNTLVNLFFLGFGYYIAKI